MRLNKTTIESLPTPAKGYAYYWDFDGAPSGFGVRVSYTGSATYVLQRRIDGKPVRITLGAHGDLTPQQAQKKGEQEIALMLSGTTSKLKKKKDAEAAQSFGDALRDYVEQKKHSRTGKPLKPRTKLDYLGMIEGNGALVPLKDKPINKITGEDLREIYSAMQTRSIRQAAYAMQVARAVFYGKGVQIPDSPFSKQQATLKRIKIPQSNARREVIPRPQIGAWWIKSGELGDAGLYLRFCLLTGVRGGESNGSKVRGEVTDEGMLVHHVDRKNRTITMPETKNSKSHTIYLSKQAWEIVEHFLDGKEDDAKLFGVSESAKRRALEELEQAVGVRVTGHRLRATFETEAARLLPAHVCDGMANHSDGGNVSKRHYIQTDPEDLKRGWQVIADHVEGLAGAVL